MATPHLTSASAATASARHLNGTGTHLLVVRKMSDWTNKTLVVTPSETKYANAVAYGDTSYYNSTGGGLKSDGQTIVNLVNAKWNAMTGTGSWQDGKRNMFAYYARKGGPYRFVNLPRSNLDRGLECGASRIRLKFSCRHIPLGMASSVKAYLRLWCPSWGICDYSVGTDIISASNFNYSEEHKVRCQIGDSGMTPASISGAGTFSILNYANEGRISGSSWSDPGTQCDAVELDCWDRQDSLVTSPYYLARVYLKQGGAVGEYYSDMELSASSHAALKSQIKATGDVYVGMGADIVNGFANDNVSLTLNATKTLCVQRVELVFKLSMNKFNA